MNTGAPGGLDFWSADGKFIHVDRVVEDIARGMTWETLVSSPWESIQNTIENAVRPHIRQLPTGYSANDIFSTYAKWDDIKQQQDHVKELTRRILNYNMKRCRMIPFPDQTSVMLHFADFMIQLRKFLNYVVHATNLYASQGKLADERAGVRQFYNINKSMTSVAPALDTFLYDSVEKNDLERQKRFKQESLTKRRRITTKRHTRHT